jgi:hypothetical protein
MLPVLFHCPNTKRRVQGWVAEKVSDDNLFVPIQCIACTGFHMINPGTGKVLGDANEKKD